MIGIVTTILTIYITLKFHDYRWGDIALDVVVTVILLAFLGTTTGGLLLATLISTAFIIYSYYVPFQHED